jgi:2-oxoglutarate ferredoxin oxidoreductase subunit alpha
MEWLVKWLPKFGGVVKQAEDELSAINMCIGSALTGTRTMTATCGPGIALMQEGIGQLGMAEVPVIIVDAQRSGPSTGMPTKPEQSDINLLCYGGAGDFPRVVIAPGTPEECFWLTITGCNLMEKYQVPVFMCLDQGLSQNTATMDPLDLAGVKIDRGERLTKEQVAELDVYKRYLFTESGASPFAPPGTPGGMGLVTGNEHDEFGLVSVDPINRNKQMDKRQGKMESMKPELPKAVTFGVETADISFIGVGMCYGVILEAMDLLAEKGIHTQYHQVRTLWPMLEETPAFTRRCPNNFVVEYNYQAQLMKLISAHGGNENNMHSILRYDGVPMQAKDLVNAVIKKLNLEKEEVA